MKKYFAFFILAFSFFLFGQSVFAVFVPPTPPKPKAFMGRLEGTVSIGPITPVCIDGIPCYRFDETVLIKKEGMPIYPMKVKTNPTNGSFGLNLIPGTYYLRLPDVSLCNQLNVIARGQPCFGPYPVTIVAGQTTNVLIGIDTGLR